ncbi:NAD-dependent epimerase/dehydratase family protein [Mycolicibacterium psychrotolerans]|uniref:NAD-dependent epimerase/dehydratase domain-containing protein n=1 Tax=Mycolicibacterium psychrotolerans TaxID=216929 RepID=A0A7I7MGZ4_9MYCO|nr:NAD-dependent epimerase/dehydratase family protein [Mycolicibacterium psychrotolerans]BBX70803.1 hypothetical protein MPSYJ_42640 [Mycolicibacterium psychrotolerans]
MAGEHDKVIVVTGANGFVGARTCAALAQRGARIRAVVRRKGVAPRLDSVEEWVGAFGDQRFAAEVVAGSSAVVTTVHPMGSDRATQHRVAVEGTPVLARAAGSGGAARLVHLSTAAVYDRGPDAGDVDESAALVGDDAGDYPVTKRDTDAALAQVHGITRILVRPPAILGPGPTSIWNTLRPRAMAREESAHRTNPDKTFAWVHVDDLAELLADLATERIPTSRDVERGPLDGGCTAVNVAGGPATQREYVTVVTGALGVEPVWDDGPAWTGQIVADRAHRWGWTPRIGTAQALEELREGLRSGMTD